MPNKTNSILLVEDDTEVAEIVGDYLQQADYAVELIHSGAGVVERVKTLKPQLILLDIMLPEVDGTTICQEIRAFSEVPIIMLTGKVDEIDRLQGYNLGADDYICKPVNPREILARVKTVLRRFKPDSNSAPISSASELKLELNESRLLAVYQGKRLDLTVTEFKLLKLLFTKEGHVFSRKQIKNRIYPDHKEASDRAIDTCVKKLRKKMSAVSSAYNPIHSIYGLGYKFDRSE
jgi:two-component system response regulator BaeR